MGLEDEIVKACKGIVNHKIKNALDLRRTKLDTCITSAVEIFNNNNKKLSLKGIKATGKYINGGYEVNYSGESINGTIAIMDIDQDKTGVKPNNDVVLSVTCKAHSCVTRSLYEGKIPETDIMEFIKYATRGPTLNDRWRRIAGSYHGEL
jgi:hypothetical protein